MRDLLLLSSLLALGCGQSPTTPDMGWPYPQIAAETQRTGDAAAGYAALLNNGYVSCGIPYSLYSQVFPPAPAALQLPGRTGHNATLPYSRTAFVAKSGVEVVSANCLACHAAVFDGKVVVGLGAHDADFTVDQSQTIDAAVGLVADPKERAEMQKFADRIDAISPYTLTLTRGVNPADNLAAVLFAHRDPATLAWSKTPLLALPPATVIPVDVPPWWRMKKKTAMFYSAAGRGDHARIMMTASTLCTDSVDEAKAIDAYFGDVHAYITSLTAPPYPWPIDAALAQKGHLVFDQTCSECHGRYGEGGVYPNEVIPIDVIGTDDKIVAGAQFAEVYINWFKASYYGQTARLEPQRGYVAPPLDGVWATAPFLHNGSVPTIAAVLDSTRRPKYWTRNFEDTSAYDPAALGWKFTAVDHGQAGEANATARSRLYDTTLPGYGNGGHAFGDRLSDGDRTAVIGYLKTL